MNTFTATSARSNFFQLLKRIIKGHLPVRISCKEGSVVVLSEDDYESLMETAELLAIPGFKASIKKADREIKKGDLVFFEEAFKE